MSDHGNENMGQARDAAQRTRQRPTSRDVAQLAGVSMSTVSNVLNRPERVTDAKRERVEAAMRELGFVRNRSARQLRLGQGQAIGLMIHDIAGPYSTAVARGVEKGMAEAGYLVMLCSSGGDPELERRQLLQLEEQGARGILAAPSSTGLEALNGVRDRGTAAVLLDRPSPDGDHCSVSIDDVKGAELAARHLLAMGHRRVALVNGEPHRQQCRDRREGLHRAVRSAGLDVESTVSEHVISTLDAAAGQEVVARILAEDAPPTAVMSINDHVALGVMRGLQARGLRIPDDVAVVGYDDLDLAAMLAPGLTSVRRPKDEFGRRGAQLLLDEIENPATHVHQQIVFQTELIVRASSDPTAR